MAPPNMCISSHPLHASASSARTGEAYALLAAALIALSTNAGSLHNRAFPACQASAGRTCMNPLDLNCQANCKYDTCRLLLRHIGAREKCLRESRRTIRGEAKTDL